MERSFVVGDVIKTPMGTIGTVVFISDAGDRRICVETPWSAQWVRYADHELTLLIPARSAAAIAEAFPPPEDS